MKLLLGLLVAVLGLLAGCSGHRTRVDCEGHLTPINAPAPAAKPGDHP